MSNAVSVWRRYEANSSKLYKCCASAKASLEGREEEKNGLGSLRSGQVLEVRSILLRIPLADEDVDVLERSRI